MKLIAFWSYDLFPYVLSGEVDPERTRTGPAGKVYVPSYQGWFEPLTVLHEEYGKQIADALKKLEADKRHETAIIHETFNERVAALAPFLRNHIDGLKR